MPRVTPWVSMLLATALGGCGGQGAFGCSDDDACSGAGPGAQCEANGYCSFEDETCPEGRRFGDHAGDALGGQCVTPASATGSTSGGPTSTTLDPSLDESGSPSTGSSDDTGPVPQAPWWDCRWAARRALTLELPDTGETLFDVPVLMVLDPTRIDAAIMALDGRDLRFVTEDGAAVLPLDIEQWSPAGLSWAWVRVPELHAGSNRIDMYYGSPEAPALDPSEVWSSYTGVWHLGFELADATGINPPGDGLATTTSGQAGPAQHFARPSEGMEVLPSALADGLFTAGGTITAMIRPSGWGGNGEGLVLRRSDNAAGDGGWVLALDRDREGLRFSRGFTTSRGTWYSLDPPLTLHTWHHVAVVYQDDPVSDPAVFIDGVPQRLDGQAAPNGRPEPDTAASLFLGGVPTTTSQTFDGIIDEVRMAPVPRSPAWILVQEAALRDELVSYGAAQSPSSCPPR